MNPLSRKSIFPLPRTALFAAAVIAVGGVVGCDDDDAGDVDVATGNGGTVTDTSIAQTEDGQDEARTAGAQGSNFTAAENQDRTAGTVTGEANSDAISLSKALPEKIAMGTPMRYEINVTAAEDLNGVVIREQLPDGFELESATPGGEVSAEGNVVLFRMGSMAADEQRAIQIVGTPQSAGDLESCTTFDFERGVCTVFTVVNPSLALTKTGPETAAVCEPITFTYTLKNTGETEATDVMLLDQLPEGLAVVDGEREVRFEIGTLAPGETVERQVEVVAEQSGNYQSYAYADSNFDEVRSKNVKTQVVGPQLDLRVEAARGYDFIGKTTQFNVTVTNSGQAPSLNTMVDASVEGVGEIVGVNGQMGNQENTESDATARLTDDGIELGTLAAGESRTFSVEVQGEEAGRITLNADAVSICGRTEAQLASAQGQGAMQIRALTALQVSVVDKQDPVKVGEQTTYELTVINEGSADDSNLQVTGQLPKGVTFVGVEGPTQVSAEGQNLTFAALETLPAGESVTWYITVEATEAAGSTKLTINATSNAVTSQVTAEEPTRLY